MRTSIGLIAMLFLVLHASCGPARQPSEFGSDGSKDGGGVVFTPLASALLDPTAMDPPNAAGTATPDSAQSQATPAEGQMANVPIDLLMNMKADLADRLGIATDDIEVAAAESVMWRDGSLGCPEPGMMYTQAIVEGYRVILIVEGQEYDYRASDQGAFKLCLD